MIEAPVELKKVVRARVTNEMKRRVKTVAKESGVDESRLVRTALEQFLDRRSVDAK